MTRILGWLACAGAVILLVVAMVTGTVPATAAGAAVTVRDAVVRLAAVPGRPAAGYFTLVAGAAPVELTGVVSPAARIELHGSTMAGGVMRMDRLRAVTVAAGRTIVFAPGGNHLMLFGVPSGVRPGGMVPLTFVFADGTRVAVAAIAAAAGDAPPPAMATPRGAH